MGYHLAFPDADILGVDIEDQPNYPFAFAQADALTFDTTGYDLIHASPPCQAFSIAGNLARAQGKQASKVDLLAVTRWKLECSGVPYVIENVKGAPLIDPVTLCGSMFGLKVRRHRLFESNRPLVRQGPCMHKQQGKPVGVYYVMGDSIPKGGTTAKTIEEASEAMGIDWMTWNEIKEAVPPAYTQWLAPQLL